MTGVKLGSYEGVLLSADEALSVLRLMLERAGYTGVPEGEPPVLTDDALAAVIEEARRTEDLEQQLGRARERIKDLTQELAEQDEKLRLLTGELAAEGGEQ